MEEITTAYEEGSSKSVRLHDGSYLQLSKLASEWDPTDREAAMHRILQAKISKEVLTGLLYIHTEEPDLHAILDTSATPLNQLKKEKLCPGSGVLARINAELR
jgi:2-oxoglutarate ferredoxin oxidoreductase subunit beta